MAQFYVEVTESKKWIAPAIEAADVEEASAIAMQQAGQRQHDELVKFVNHVRAI